MEKGTFWKCFECLSNQINHKIHRPQSFRIALFRKDQHTEISNTNGYLETKLGIGIFHRLKVLQITHMLPILLSIYPVDLPRGVLALFTKFSSNSRDEKKYYYFYRCHMKPFAIFVTNFHNKQVTRSTKLFCFGH
jgi:hypothetical protein